MALLSFGLVACDDDYAPETQPQTNEPERIMEIGSVAVTTGETTFDLAQLMAGENGEDPVKIGTVTIDENALPANAFLRAEVEFATDENFEHAFTLQAQDFADNYDIEITPSTLQDAYFNNITRNPATVEMYVRTILYVITNDDAIATVGQDGVKYFDTHKITLKPLNKVVISQNYYIVGGPNDWAQSAADKSIKFSHSDLDVYEDPIFTVVFDAAASGDTWFAIGDDEACEAIAGGDWTKLMGIVGGDSEATEGKLDFRYNMGADNSFKVAEGAKKIRVTLNMMDYTFKVEPVSIADAYYLIGGPGEWNTTSARTMQFSHSDKDVFDDPVFTYTFEGSGSEMWFAFGDEESLNGMDNNDWSNVYGTTSGNGNSGTEGTFARRSSLSDDGSFKVDGTAKYYRFTINMSDMTYEVKALNFAQYIYEAGVNNNWGDVEQPLYSPESDGKYYGFFYAQEDSWTDGKGAFKFRGAADNWDNGNYGTGTLAEDGLSGTLVDDGNSGNIMPAPGFYRADVDLAAMTFTLTPITSIGVIGPGQPGGWDTDTDMTYNPETKAWEVTIELAADQIKFRANDDWAINWGGTFDNLTQGGDNLNITEAGTYFIQLFAHCDTKAYAVITKQ